MNSEANTNAEERGDAQDYTDAWREVGEQFQELGKAVAQALRATWESEETRQRLQSLQEGLEAMASEVGQAVKETVLESEEVRRAAAKAAETTQTATQQALEELRPQLLSALHQINKELEILIERLRSQASEPAHQPAQRVPVEQPKPSDLETKPAQPHEAETAESVDPSEVEPQARQMSGAEPTAEEGPPQSDETPPTADRGGKQRRWRFWDRPN